jgi:hypothetical protein
MALGCLPKSEKFSQDGGGHRMTEVSALRLYVMRFLYFGNFVFLGLSVWPVLLHPAKPLAPLNGVAFSFWAALSTLCGIGLRYPLKMVPVL